MSVDSLPAEFLDRLTKILPPDQFDSVVASFDCRKPTTFRLNSIVAPVEETLDLVNLAGVDPSPIPWMTDANETTIAFEISYENRSILTHHPAADEGKIYFQNLSSMLAPLILDPQPGEIVLDLAAAPGGKTIQIAQMMNNEGMLSAVEVVRARMFKMQSNLKRCGVTMVKTYLTDGRSVGRKTPARFDRVLLDAPCSSEARFQIAKPKSWETWSPRKIRESARKQFGLLKSAIHATRPGGLIVYCTCSFAPEENERVVHKVLQKFGEQIEIMPIELPIDNWLNGLTTFDGKEFDPSIANCRRILPDNLMDAFFIAKIHKSAS